MSSCVQSKMPIKPTCKRKKRKRRERNQSIKDTEKKNREKRYEDFLIKSTKNCWTKGVNGFF